MSTSNNWEIKYFEKSENFRAKCISCGDTFTYCNMEPANYHFDQKHPNTEQETVIWKQLYFKSYSNSHWQCTYCPQTYLKTTSSPILCEHLQFVHNKCPIIKFPCYMGCIEEHIKQRDDYSAQCKKCGQIIQFSISPRLEDHIFTRHFSIWINEEQNANKQSEINMLGPSTSA